MSKTTRPVGQRGLRQPRRRPRYLESIEQRLFIQRWRIDPRTRALAGCSVPNGGLRSARQAAILKAEGVEAGVPDWLCFEPSKHTPHVGLAIEFKSPTGAGRVSEHQARWHSHLHRCGWRVEICTSAAQAWSILCNHLGIRDD